MMTARLLSLLIGYVFGCLLTAEAVSYHRSGKSIRTMGSQNPGMTNVMRLYGKKYGFIVLAGDLLKTVVACFLANALFVLPFHLAILYAGFGTILGHNFPFWNGFHGGKGVACTCMTLFCFSPIWGLLACIIGLIACLLTHYLAIGGTLIPAVFLLFTLVFYTSYEVHLLAFLIFLMMFERSFVALKRILAGEEEKALWSDKTKS